MPQTAFLIWAFFETLLHLGIARTSSALRSKKRCSHLVATSTFATFLRDVAAFRHSSNEFGSALEKTLLPSGRDVDFRNVIESQYLRYYRKISLLLY